MVNWTNEDVQKNVNEVKSGESSQQYLLPQWVVAPLNVPETYTELCFICDASFKNYKVEKMPT